MPDRRAWPLVLAAALLHSLVMALAGPPLSWWALGPLSVLPLIWIGLSPRARPGRDFFLTLLGGVPLWLWVMWWMKDVTNLGFVPAVFLMSSYAAAFVYLLAWSRRRLPRLPATLAVPILWVGVEFFRGELFFDGYAWGFPVHPLIDAPFLAHSAKVGGVYYTSLLFMLLLGGIADLKGPPARVRPGIAGISIAVVIIGITPFIAPLSPDGATTIRAAAIQTNVPQIEKLAWGPEDEAADFAEFVALTRRAAAGKPHLILWPEAMVPGISLEPEALAVMRERQIMYNLGDGKQLDATAFATRLLDLQRELNIPMLVGEEGVEGLGFANTDDGLLITRKYRYNSVYHLVDGRTTGVRYDKIHLTPFGETMPYFRLFPWLQQRMLDWGARGMSFDLSPGGRVQVFTIDADGRSVGVVTPICFEITNSALCREMVYGDNGVRRAHLIANVTNDGWFGDTDLARVQHLQIARWRCLELGTPMIRAANTGISAAINHRGEVLQSAPARDSAFLWEEIPLAKPGTLYARVGNAAGWSAFAATLLVIAATGYAAWRAKRTKPPAPANSVSR